MIFLFLSIVKCNTNADIYNILRGNWSVEIMHPLSDDSSNSTCYFTSTNDFQKLTGQYIQKDQSIDLNVTFHSNGIFDLFINEVKMTTFNFSPDLPPHLTSFGRWNSSNSSYSADIISTKFIQLQLFETQETLNQHTIFSFTKLADEYIPPWWEKYYQIMFIGVVGILCYFVSMGVRKCQINKIQKEALEMIKNDEKEQNMKKQGNQDHKAKASSKKNKNKK